jgi:hypothetical protein
MRKLKLTKKLQERFLEALADTGSVSTAASVAGTSRTRVYELRKADPTFASAWQDVEEIAVDRLQDEARRRALEGVPERLVSGGRLVRDGEGQPITIRRYSDNLLLALIKAHRPPQRERAVAVHLQTEPTGSKSLEAGVTRRSGCADGCQACGNSGGNPRAICRRPGHQHDTHNVIL